MSVHHLERSWGLLLQYKVERESRDNRVLINNKLKVTESTVCNTWIFCTRNDACLFILQLFCDHVMVVKSAFTRE
jgi:hypothetical protein